MIKRSLGATDMDISVIGLGAFAIGGWMWAGQQDDDSAAAIRAAVAAGINWIDTAPIYGDGRADAVIATVLAELPPAERPLVFTKFGYHVVDGVPTARAGRAQVIADCEASLRRLGVERLDLFQQHWPAVDPIAETAAACAELLKAGKIRAVGLGNASLPQLQEWSATGLPIASHQCRYSLLRREAAADLLPWCAEHGVSGLAHTPLHRGLLTGTWTADKTFAAGDHRASRPEFTGEGLARSLALVEDLKLIAAEDDLTVAQLALGYLLCTEGVSGVIVGARNAEQGAALGDMAMPLKQVQMDAVDAALAKHGF